MTLLVRPSQSGDAPAIRALLEKSFPTSAEAELVEALRREDQLVIDFVAMLEGAVVGHIGFSRMTVAADDVRVPALALAPLAVWPSSRGRGVAKRLMEQGLAAANGRGISLIFVVGDPDFYGRFGFRPEIAASFASPFHGPNWLAQWLSSPRRVAVGRADHAPAFSTPA